jgi:hypothetical protein
VSQREVRPHWFISRWCGHGSGNKANAKRTPSSHFGSDPVHEPEMSVCCPGPMQVILQQRHCECQPTFTTAEIADGFKICTGDGGGRAEGRCENPAPVSLFSEPVSVGAQLYKSNPGDDKIMFQRPYNAAAAQCSGPPPPERGRQAAGYSFYAKAAACYIYKRFHESRN